MTMVPPPITTRFLPCSRLSSIASSTVRGTKNAMVLTPLPLFVQERDETRRRALGARHLNAGCQKRKALPDRQAREIGHLLHEDRACLQDDLVDDEVFRREVGQARAVFAEAVDPDRTGSAIDEPPSSLWLAVG